MNKSSSNERLSLYAHFSIYYLGGIALGLLAAFFAPRLIKVWFLSDIFVALPAAIVVNAIYSFVTSYAKETYLDDEIILFKNGEGELYRVYKAFDDLSPVLKKSTIISFFVGGIGIPLLLILKGSFVPAIIVFAVFYWIFSTVMRLCIKIRRIKRIQTT